MGKALLGTHATPSNLRLLDEVRALRQRVAELEAALAAAEAASEARVRAQEADLGTDLDVDELADAAGREHATT